MTSLRARAAILPEAVNDVGAVLTFPDFHRMYLLPTF
jgi:hypothetical protein